MAFEELLGNQRLKDNLIQSISRGKISHFYLISGPRGSGKHTLSRLLAAAIVCRGDHKPCMDCPACRKVMSGSHPDFITVDDPEKKTVPVELIRQARADMYVQPNEANRKIYLFPRAQDMGIPGQNALLKILEEPPAYGVFILLTDNPEKLLPTVRSRCTQLRLTALPDGLLRSRLMQTYPNADADTLSGVIQRSGGYLGQAMQLMEADLETDPQTRQFLESYINRDPVGLLRTLTPMEKWKRDQLIETLTRWSEILHSALLCRSGMPALSPVARQLGSVRSSKELMAGISHLQKCIEYAQGNISPANICGYLEWNLR